MKALIKSFIPEALIILIQRVLKQIPDIENSEKSVKIIFEKIYRDEIWGKSNNPKDYFCSSDGSRDPLVTIPYIEAVSEIISSSEQQFDAVDLGCGDFYVGSQLRKYFKNYVACDVAESLILRNKLMFKNDNVDFRILDITEDDLPQGDVVFLRQVLQHLSNKQIKKVIQKIQTNFKYLILTEHLPSDKKFTANLDKPAGPNIRIGLGKNGSGVVLSKHPFNLMCKEERILCEVLSGNSIIRTNLFIF